jgi:hypothetical protein
MSNLPAKVEDRCEVVYVLPPWAERWTPPDRRRGPFARLRCRVRRSELVDVLAFEAKALSLLGLVAWCLYTIAAELWRTRA